MWIYLSPHCDDIALSCGGFLWEQAQAGEQVEVWTVCAGDPPDLPLSPFAQALHARWGVGVLASRVRHQEDIQACQAMQVGWRHFNIPDCIYRQAEEPLYASEEAIFGALHPAEESLVDGLACQLNEQITLQDHVVCPLALGGHVDHRLVRTAAERSGRSLWYYADYPYVLQDPQVIDRLCQAGWGALQKEISEAGLCAWQAAVAAHASQISTFWADQPAMQEALLEYNRMTQGNWLWRQVKGGSRGVNLRFV